jgi:hypothetical protein
VDDKRRDKHRYKRRDLELPAKPVIISKLLGLNFYDLCQLRRRDAGD